MRDFNIDNMGSLDRPYAKSQFECLDLFLNKAKYLFPVTEKINDFETLANYLIKTEVKNIFTIIELYGESLKEIISHKAGGNYLDVYLDFGK